MTWSKSRAASPSLKVCECVRVMDMNEWMGVSVYM